MSVVGVTGASGFLGLALTRALAARGHHVRTFQRTRTPALDELARAGSVTVHGVDLGDRAASEHPAFEGLDALFHVAAKAGVWGPRGAYVRANVDATRHVLDACRRFGIAKLVYTSTPSVVHRGGDIEGGDESLPYGEHFPTAYPETKALAEREVLAANGATLATVALRPHLIWGPGDTNLTPRIVDRARRGRLALVGGGRKLIDGTYIDSAVHAHVLALEALAPSAPCAGRAYFIAQGEPTPVRELVLGIVGAYGLTPRVIDVPTGLAHVLGAVIEDVHRVLRIEREPPLTRFVVEQLATAHWYDLAAAERDLGYRAPVTTAEGLRRLAASVGR